MKDFFVSYNKADAWAEWIAWQLEEAGYSTVIQAWDFRPGSNFVLEMHRAAQEAERTVHSRAARRLFRQAKTRLLSLTFKALIRQNIKSRPNNWVSPRPP
jgi:hypothetical protein